MRESMGETMLSYDSNNPRVKDYILMGKLNKPFSRKSFYSKSGKETNSPNLKLNKSFIKALAWGLDELSLGPTNLFSGSEGRRR